MQRNERLRSCRKELQKEKKKPERSEECFFTATYNMMLRKAHAAGSDHKLLLIDGLEDPFVQEEILDEPLIVSSDPEEDLSEYFCNFLLYVIHAFGFYLCAFGLLILWLRAFGFLPSGLYLF